MTVHSRLPLKTSDRQQIPYDKILATERRRDTLSARRCSRANVGRFLQKKIDAGRNRVSRKSKELDQPWAGPLRRRRRRRWLPAGHERSFRLRSVACTRVAHDCAGSKRDNGSHHHAHQLHRSGDAQSDWSAGGSHGDLQSNGTDRNELHTYGERRGHRGAGDVQSHRYRHRLTRRSIGGVCRSASMVPMNR